MFSAEFIFCIWIIGSYVWFSVVDLPLHLVCLISEVEFIVYKLLGSFGCNCVIVCHWLDQAWKHGFPYEWYQTLHLLACGPWEWGLE